MKPTFTSTLHKKMFSTEFYRYLVMYILSLCFLSALLFWEGCSLESYYSCVFTVVDLIVNKTRNSYKHFWNLPLAHIYAAALY